MWGRVRERSERRPQAERRHTPIGSCGIEAIGIGLALAIFIDATLVRALVVPAAMRLMGRANWWAPAWMAKWLKPLQH